MLLSWQALSDSQMTLSAQTEREAQWRQRETEWQQREQVSRTASHELFSDRFVTCSFLLAQALISDLARLQQLAVADRSSLVGQIEGLTAEHAICGQREQRLEEQVRC